MAVLESQVRHWVGKACYPGKQPFLVGSVMAETELEAEREVVKLWNKTFPFPPPRSFTMVPGMIWFKEDNDAGN